MVNACVRNLKQIISVGHTKSLLGSIYIDFLYKMVEWQAIEDKCQNYQDPFLKITCTCRSHIINRSHDLGGDPLEGLNPSLST